MHKKTNQIWCFIVLFIFLFPSGNVIAAHLEDALEKQAHTILQLIENDKWEESVEPAKKLKDLYTKNKWKYQLLGDEDEYEQLNRQIENLQMAVREKDSTQSKIILSTIVTIIKDIYSL